MNKEILIFKIKKSKILISNVLAEFKKMYHIIFADNLNISRLGGGGGCGVICQH